MVYLGWRDGEYSSYGTGLRIFVISGTAPVSTTWSGGVVYTSTVSRDDLQPALSLAVGGNGRLRMVWNEIPGWTWTDAEGGGEYERLADSANIYYSVLSDGVWQEPLRINDYPGLGSKSDGAYLDTVLVSDTLHVVWSGLHYVDAIRGQGDDTNIYLDAISLEPITATVTKYYPLAGNVSAMRVGAEGDAGTLYYLYADHRGSLSLVTDSDGDELGRVWYDPFGEIISHTIPLTLTDRLFTGEPRESTIGLYQLGAEWYDPHTARYLLPDATTPTAPPGTNPYVATYLGVLRPSEGMWGSVSDSARNALVVEGLSGIAKTGLPSIYQAGRRVLMWQAVRLASMYNATRAAAAPFRQRAAFWARVSGRARWLSPVADPLYRYNQWRHDRLVAQADLRWRAGLNQLDEKLGQLQWLNKHGDDILGGVLGVAIDLLDQGIGDQRMVWSGDLTPQQAGWQMVVAAGGSSFGWGLGWLVTGAVGNVAGFAAGVVWDVTWNVVLLPEAYEWFPGLKPMNERAAEPQPLP